jgi:hypothetical protein
MDLRKSLAKERKEVMMDKKLLLAAVISLIAASFLLSGRENTASAEFAVMGCQPGGATPTAAPQPCPTNANTPYFPQVNIVPGFAPTNVNVPTYTASLIEGVPAASGTDVLCLSGKAGVVVRIWRWDVSGTETTAGTIPVSINFNSALDTGGTAGTTPTIVPHDPSDAAAGATLIYYTANPTIGSAVGALWTQKLTLLAPATAASDLVAVRDYPHNFATKPIILRTAAQQACLNWNGKTTSGNLIDSNITWTETVN